MDVSIFIASLRNFFHLILFFVLDDRKLDKKDDTQTAADMAISKVR